MCELERDGARRGREIFQQKNTCDHKSLCEAELYFFSKKNSELWSRNFFCVNKKNISDHKCARRSHIARPYRLFRKLNKVVIVGKDKETGKNISIMSHQSPEALFEDEEILLNFKNQLISSIEEMKSRCVPNSLDFVVFGGIKEEISDKEPDENFRMGIDDPAKFMKGPYDDYVRSIRFLNYIISQKTGFSPVVMLDPNENFKTDEYSLNVYFDNENRRLYMIRPEQDKDIKNEPYMASEAENQIKKIKTT